MSEQLTLGLWALMEPETLAEARVRLGAGTNSGVRCPCCRQYVKRYKRRLLPSYVAWLVWLIKEMAGSGEDWADQRNAPPALDRNGDYAKLQYWSFVESQQKRSGFWRPTRAGLDFAEGKARVPKYVFVYDNRVEGFSAETVGLMDVLRDPSFDYDNDVLAPTVGFDASLPTANIEYTTVYAAIIRMLREDQGIRQSNIFSNG